MTKAYIAALFVLFGMISFLVLITRGQSALVKRKIILGALILSLTGAGTAVGCRSGDARTSARELWSFEGWVDDNTFRIIADGTPRSTLTNKIARKESAKRSAILMAQYRTMEKFKPHVNESCAGMSDYASTGVAMSRELSGIVKGGRIVAEKYDEGQNCKIVYEASARNLKKTVNDRPGY